MQPSTFDNIVSAIDALYDRPSRIQCGELTFVIEHWDDVFPFGCEFSYQAATPFGTRYDLWWGQGPVSDDAESRVRGEGSDQHLPWQQLVRLAEKYGQPGTGAHWAAWYHVDDDQRIDLCEEQTIENAMQACSEHYRCLLMQAMARAGVEVAGLPLLPSEDSPSFRQEDADNWTPAP